jgi:hypothetical protein
MPVLTQRRLKEVLDYNPETGLFTRLITAGGVKKGAIAGTQTKNGYITISVDNHTYLAHRLVYLYMEGYFPEHGIDHLKGIKTDNRWKEIREATKVCNGQNCQVSARNNSGFNGVGYVVSVNRWKARITIHGKQIHIGVFDSPEEAALARCRFEDEHPYWHCNYQNVNRVKLRKMGYII